MKILFDNCTSPVLAATLGGFVRHLGHEARHLREMPCGPDADDLVWITLLAQDPAHWIVITGDDHLYRNRAERAAFRSSGLTGFVFARGYQKTPMNQWAALLLWRWPDIEQISRIVRGGALYRLPVKLGAKIEHLPL